MSLQPGAKGTTLLELLTLESCRVALLEAQRQLHNSEHDLRSEEGASPFSINIRPDPRPPESILTYDCSDTYIQTASVGRRYELVNNCVHCITVVRTYADCPT